MGEIGSLGSFEKVRHDGLDGMCEKKDDKTDSEDLASVNRSII